MSGRKVHHTKLSYQTKSHTKVIPLDVVAAIREELNQMKRANLIKKSTSMYASPVVCVPKTDWSLQVCIEFWMNNQAIINDAYLMHQMEEQLEAMVGLTIFTTLNLTKWYHQLILYPGSKHITAFDTLDDLYQWKVLPQGMKMAGAVFQRVMDHIIRDLQPKCVSVYINDITV